MSQRSHIAISGSTAIWACSVACSAPSRTSSGIVSARAPASSSNHSACVGKLVGGRSSATRSSGAWSEQALALVGEHRVGDAHLAEGQRHAERLAAVEQAHDGGVGLALGLRVPVAVERRHERAPALQVELAHLIGAPEVQVDRALVDGRVGARRLGRAEQLARGDVDDRKAVRGGRAQRHVRRGVSAGPAGNVGARGPVVARLFSCCPAASASRSSPALTRSSAWASQRGPRNSASSCDSGPSWAAQSRCWRKISGLSWSRIAASTGRSRNSSGWRQKNWSSASSPATYTARPRVARGSAGAPPHLAQRGDRAGERDDHGGVQLADVDAELQRVGRDHRAQLPRIRRPSSSRRCWGV